MRLVDVEEISALLMVKAKTIYQWAELGQIPCVKLNGALRFDLDDIMNWIASCKKRSESGYNPLAQTPRCPRKGVKS